MRRSGRTIRIVDVAIQILFTYGKVQVLGYGEVPCSKCMKTTVFDHSKEKHAKHELFFRIIKRLNNEHNHEEYEAYNSDYLIVLKNHIKK